MASSSYAGAGRREDLTCRITLNSGDAADPYPGVLNVTHFDDKTTPNSRDYLNSITQVAVWNVSPSDTIMIANLDVRWSQPNYVLDSTQFVDNSHDGFFDPGETVRFYFYLHNDWLTANNATVTMTSNDPNVIFTIPSVFYPTINGDGAYRNNSGQPLEYIVPNVVNPTLDSFFVTIESDGGSFRDTFAMEQVVGRTRILLIDDDRGANYEDIYRGDLYKKRVPCSIWSKQSQGSPAGSLLQQYPVVMWYTGDSAVGYLQTADISCHETIS